MENVLSAIFMDLPFLYLTLKLKLDCYLCKIKQKYPIKNIFSLSMNLTSPVFFGRSGYMSTLCIYLDFYLKLNYGSKLLPKNHEEYTYRTNR